jgi:NAD(P) transhydrogenase subunit alpha
MTLNAAADASRPVTVGLLREHAPGERRVALVPAVLGPLTEAGYRVLVEAGAGEAAGFPDPEYQSQGARIASRAEVLAEARVLAGVRAPASDVTDALRPGAVVIGQFSPVLEPELTAALARCRACAFSLELLPRITRAQSMDVLSSQATVTGYRAVLLAAAHLERFFPMLMTAAGTIPPARVFVLGAGVAGLQAVATARRLGAAVTAHDVRKAAKGEVESLGARFVELPELPVVEGKGGYAAEQPADVLARQREAIAPVVADADAVITTAAIPGRRAPLVLTAEMVAAMRPGSVVVDIAADSGGNCELTVAGKQVTRNHVTVIGLSNPASGMAQHASQLFARNMATFLLALLRDGELEPDFGDELIAETCVTREGDVLHAPAREAMGKVAAQ